MAIYITIDGGTTNTRLSLYKDGDVITTATYNVGARSGIDNMSLLRDAVKDGISKIINENNLEHSDVECIIASGMITSEFGLCNIPHTTAPAGIEELHNTMHKVVLDDITTIPFVFIRGVKTSCTDLDTADMMRGEETELMGIMCEGDSNCIYILPGSHSKIIHTDAMGRISEFSTMLTGEMIYALSQNTILKDCVDLKNEVVDEEYLLKGYEYCEKYGLNNTLFKTRILKNMFSANPCETYSFFLGAVLYGEIIGVINANPSKILIGGKESIKNAMYVILSRKSNADVRKTSEHTAKNSTTVGAVKIYEYKK